MQLRIAVQLCSVQEPSGPGDTAPTDAQERIEPAATLVREKLGAESEFRWIGAALSDQPEDSPWKSPMLAEWSLANDHVEWTRWLAARRGVGALNDPRWLNAALQLAILDKDRVAMNALVHRSEGLNPDGRSRQHVRSAETRMPPRASAKLLQPPTNPVREWTTNASRGFGS